MQMGEMNGKFTSSTNALSGCGRDCDALLNSNVLVADPVLYIPQSRQQDDIKTTAFIDPGNIFQCFMSRTIRKHIK